MNGNRSIIEQTTFQINRTRIWYKRGKKKEIIEGHGYPLNEQVDIMLLILNRDLIKVKYIYWELVNKSVTNETKFANNYYRWRFENETDDDCSCTIRQPHCTFRSDRRNELIIVSDHLCDLKLKPRPLKCDNSNCSIQVNLAPRWIVGSWRSCEGRCWPQEAIQRRSLLCVRTMSNNRIHAIPMSICSNRLGSCLLLYENVLRMCHQQWQDVVR